LDPQRVFAKFLGRQYGMLFRCCPAAMRSAVYRDGVWYLRQSTSGISIQQFGLTGDKPVPAAFLP